MENNGLDSKYEMRHHPEGIVRTVPDFVILDKPSGKWLFVIEVKRTPGSTRSVRTWDQARSYVKNNKSVHWSPINKPYFMVTNIELSYFDRADSATQFCLLKNGEEICADFGNNADRTLNDFETKVIPRIFQQIRNQDEEYSENLKLLLDEFAGLQSALSSYITNIVKSQIGKTLNSFGFQNIKNYNDQLSEWQRLNDPRASEIN